MSGVETAVNSVIEKIKEKHFIMFPHIFLSFFGNGFLFILFYYNLDASILMETHSFPAILLLSVVLSVAIYFIFNIITILDLASKKEKIGNLFVDTWLTNYYYLLAIFLARFFQSGVPFLTNLVIIASFLILFKLAKLIWQVLIGKYGPKKDKEDYTSKYEDLLESEEIVTEFIRKKFGKGAMIKVSGKELEKDRYETVVLIKKKKIRVLQNKHDEILGWEFIEN